ncbi:hypothetical protein ACFXGT_08085 [Streptomyces sp. NPDC059352]|uniref:hypothetical protein n=1 Tax=Streptomyces sp. NPDC059352 TaxID=3346810 RepID=UPI00368D054B
MAAEERMALIQALRRTGVGHTGMGASLLVDRYTHALAEELRAAGHTEAAGLIDAGLSDQD